MYNIPRYQTGSYIPGLSSQIFGAGLDRDIASEQDRLRKQAKSLGKKQQWGNIGSFLGKSGGKWLGKALSAGFAATNPLYALAVQAGGAGLGSYLGSKLGRGDDVSVKSKHGLLGSQYEDIDKYQKGMESAAKGAAWGDAASAFGQGLKSEAGKAIWDKIDPKAKTDWLGENIGSKTHKELTGMKLGDVLGQGRIAKGLEGWLGKNKPFQSEMWQATKPTREWAWEGAKDIYGAGKDLYGQYQDYRERNREPSWAGDLSPWERMKMVTGFGGGQQEGGIVGMQEGGSPEVGSPELYTSMVRKLINKLGGEEPEGMYTPEGGLTREGYAKMLGADPESISIDTLSFKNPANYMFKVSGKGAQSGADVGGTTQSRGILPLKGNILDPLMRERIEDPFERMDMEMLFREIKPEGYQEGGMAYPLQMAGGGYMPEQGFGGLIQHRKGY
jgi:hypothetical protein